MAYSILLVEDDAHIMRINRNALAKAGYNVLQAKNLSEAGRLLRDGKPNLIVLDIMLPDGNGIEWCREVRNGDHEPPILFLSAKNESVDILNGLKAGGDDYLTKPYDLDILLVKVELMLERASRIPQIVRKGTLWLDPVAHTAHLTDKDLMLTQTEFSLLLLLAQNEDKPMNADVLYEKVWRRPMGSDAQAVKSAISRLRKKLKDSDSEYTIETLRGEGYCFCRV